MYQKKTKRKYVHVLPGRTFVFKIAVGYGWNSDEHGEDTRWKATSAALTTIIKEVKSRLGSLNIKVIDDGSINRKDKIKSLDLIVKIRYSRLRATAGQMIWGSIIKHIEESDVLIFDLTPKHDHEVPPPNVLLELGYALCHSPDRTFIIWNGKTAIGNLLPSDLSGMLLGKLGNDGLLSDKSLRMSLVNKIKSLIEDKVDAG